MAPTPALLQLIRRIGLDRDDLNERCRLLQWQHCDGERLNRAAENMDSSHSAFIEALYEHLGGFPGATDLISNPDTLQRLKQRQHEYYQRLWQGPYDRGYVYGRLHVGQVHQQNHVEPKWYLASYRLYLEKMAQELFSEHPQKELFSSLLKAVFFDITLAIDLYTAAQSQAIEDSETRYARALRGSNDGIWDWHLEYDRLYVSERWASMLGLSHDHLGESSSAWFSRVHPDDLPGLRQAIDNHLNANTPHLNHEYRMRRDDGSYLWVLSRGVSEIDHKGQRRLTGSQTDISARKIFEQQLRHSARHDPLTGLANRLRLDELLKQTLQQLHNPGARAAALLFVDLDRFKLINDSLGHAYGDQVLVEVSQRMLNCLRPGDHLARFGGDEFVVLLCDLAQPCDAERVAQRILDTLHPPLYLNEQTVVVSASIGIADLPADTPAEQALQAADLALYRAKVAGKAQFARYSQDLHSAAKRQLELESALGQALERGEFVLHYQPICRIDQGQTLLTGVEALLRWQYGQELISPQEFIPSLEESGEILRVGDWVLRQACLQVRAWQLAGQRQLRCSVNLSSRQLQQPKFAERIAAILRETELPAASLILEITETQLMQDCNGTLITLRELCKLGVRLALDDFGTGYSALGYLKRFPLHILKLDKSFMGGDEAESWSIGRAIIGLGHSLGLEVVAEGVEQAEQLQTLRKERCGMAQGFWFSRPRPAEELARLFSDDDCFEGLWCLVPETRGGVQQGNNYENKSPRQPA